MEKGQLQFRIIRGKFDSILTFVSNIVWQRICFPLEIRIFEFSQFLKEESSDPVCANCAHFQTRKRIFSL